MTDSKAEKSPETASNEAIETMQTRKLIRRAERRGMIPVSWVDYEAGWHAFREKPTIKSVCQATNLNRDIAAHLIEVGYPDAEMPAYADRMAQVRKVARQIEDYNISRAMAENGQILRGVKIKLREALGPKFSNLSFDAKSLENLTPGKALVLMQFMEKLTRLEAYTLREGTDQTRVVIEDNASNGSSDASGKLARLMNEIKQAVTKKPFSDGAEIIDADFVDATFSSQEETQSSDDAWGVEGIDDEQ